MTEDLVGWLWTLAFAGVLFLIIRWINNSDRFH